ncbi:bifunctional AP-4-A phosphorylase/ADP sulfurylase [Exophiala dermatitidis]|uniref:ATP adenylyltransferase n=2 Tax=Exophiala dermatitidis TaxID=5970 RepID=H6C6V3_EXODN|nr:ATP adenylyltransferase [Exophiala dermatitidis NIH/UT8656]KAJ4522783.1 bifunctional AP-4-A phosphorylase/ADP sulfurylase [Exophiala dermatitidis]EHY59449.1 ATP adenylyltransferase [Exophiala dermatitidis NIH/UT8656]KAJ4526090.1 bifunctional AP-4-A phosphorylase/ADP sulfurylase [Exophiala dermatitidis]KAJ4526966.1 bifunctional AP-4-A phosphorylase/ADP sulfurylase [Exophiala dermatitidis]KAJ4532680.1 bifunctional AP-4-A phosphorylase/ADP sulfurylase [Exophiala dermatitidis]
MPEADTMLGLSKPLRKLVVDKFSTACKHNNVQFSETRVALLRSQGAAPFQLRYCPALAKKTKEDKGDASSKESSKSRFDPFADPAEELLVANIPGGNASHILVLNKFPVIPNHFIIATKANKPQTALLEEDDIGLTYACLRAWKDQNQEQAPSRLFAFFNSGEHSGASQPHRHLQFLPVEDMSSPQAPGWDLLLDRMTKPAHPTLPLFRDPSLPFLHFSTPLEGTPSSASLHSKYMLLLKAALSAALLPGKSLEQDIEVERDGLAVFSYNLAMTTERMAICPRRRESVAIPGAGPASSVAPNGTILGGTLMVKFEAEWDILQQDHSILDGMLTTIGFTPISW